MKVIRVYSQHEGRYHFGSNERTIPVSVLVEIDGEQKRLCHHFDADEPPYFESGADSCWVDGAREAAEAHVKRMLISSDIPGFKALLEYLDTDEGQDQVADAQARYWLPQLQREHQRTFEKIARLRHGLAGGAA